MKELFYNKLNVLVEESQILRDEPMSKHTTFKIGGPCDFFVKIRSEKELVSVIKLCKEENIRYFTLGNGSNLLVADEGFQGVVLKLEDCIQEFSVTETKYGSFVETSAGMHLSAFAMKVANQSLKGFEFAAGIPGTVGGAVFMNAGAYGGEIKDNIMSAKVLTKDGEVKNLSRKELKLSYRSSSVEQEAAIVISALFFFEKGELSEIKGEIDRLNGKRREKQPLEYPSAGSTFKRPAPKDGKDVYAGALIEQAGLRGYRVGGAMVSEKHCGFVINAQDATAKDVLTLMDDVRRIVQEKFDVVLEPEVKYIS